jgi:FkbM family methyltransferase
MYGEQMYKEWLLEIPSELNIVLDIGSNYGEFINLLDNKKIGELHYFEPDIDNFSKCSELMSMFDFTHGHNYGIFYGVKESKVQGVGDNNDGGYMISEIDNEFKDEIWGDKIVTYDGKVFKLETLEYFLHHPADLVKLDVEASEYNILENSELIKKSKYLFVEWHNKPMSFVHSFIEKNLPMYEKYKEYESHTFLKLKN